MVFKTLNGRERDISIKRYLIEWSPTREVSSWQAKTKMFLRPYWGHGIVLEEFRIPGSKLRVDLLRMDGPTPIMVEVSPESSHSYNEFFHGKSRNRFKDALKRDFKKREWGERCGFLCVELQETDFPLTEAAFARQGVIL